MRQAVKCLGQIHQDSRDIFIIVKGCPPVLQQRQQNRLTALSLPESTEIFIKNVFKIST